MNKQTILVQGAGSYVGCAIVHQLCDRIKTMGNITVRAGFTNLNEPNCKKCTAMCECVPLDLANQGMIKDALKGVNKLVIIPPYRENRVALVNGLVDIAYNMGVKRMLLISVMGAQQENITFQRNLKTIENHIGTKGDISLSALRIPSYMDNFLDLSSDIKKGTLRLPIGEGKFAPIWSRDTAEYACEVLLKDLIPNQAVDLTGPETMTGHDIARTFSEVIGKQVTFVSVSGDEWKKDVIKAGMNEWKAEGVLELYRWFAGGNGARVSNEFETRLGRKQHTLTDFIRTNLDTFRVSTVGPQ